MALRPYYSSPVAAALSGLPHGAIRALVRAGAITPDARSNNRKQAHGWSPPGILGLALLRHCRRQGADLNAALSVMARVSRFTLGDLQQRIDEGKRWLVVIGNRLPVDDLVSRAELDATIAGQIPCQPDAISRIIVVDVGAALEALLARLHELPARARCESYPVAAGRG